MYRHPMFICYVDESGSEDILAHRDSTPVIAIMAMTVAEKQSLALANGFLQLKKRYMRSGSQGLSVNQMKLSDLIQHEFKGSDVRSDIRSGRQSRQRWALGLLDGLLTLLEQHNVALAGSVYVKRDGATCPRDFYARAISDIAVQLNRQSLAADTKAAMLLDARTKVKNAPIAMRVATQRFRSKGTGDALQSLIEAPTFGHSDTHVNLQIIDLLVSGVMFPLACHAFCDDVVGNAHTKHSSYCLVWQRFASRVRALEYRYTAADGVKRGGITVKDSRNGKGSHSLYSCGHADLESTVVDIRSRQSSSRTPA